MKNKKTIIIISIITILLVLSAVVVYANLKENGLFDRFSNVYEQKKRLLRQKYYSFMKIRTY